MYLNTLTGQFPLYPGDAMLAQPGWKLGDPAPAGWVEIAPVTPPACAEDETLTPSVQLANGQWAMTWTARSLTAEELHARQRAEVRMKVMRGQTLTQEEALLLTQ